MGFSLIIMAVLCILAVPISFSIGLAAAGGLLLSDLSLVIIAQRMFTQVDMFAMLAIPFFILAGSLMDKGGISLKIVNFSSQLVGHIRGGLGMVVILACMIFGAISGSGAACTAAIGMIMIPAMKKKGYPEEFTAALIAASGPLDVIIAPSIVMVIYATTANVSVGDMFLAGYMPGILIAAALMIICFIYAKKYNFPAEPRPTFQSFFKAFGESIWAILMIVIIMGGILCGFFTATEAGVVAVVYAVIVGKYVYKGLRYRDIPQIVAESVLTTSAVMFCVATTNVLAWGLISQRIVEQATNFLLSISSSPVVFLIIANILFLFLGMIMDSTPAIILSTPILLPVAQQLGIDPIHFGIICVVNLAIGMSTPPVGITLFVASSVSKQPISKMLKPLIPMWISMLVFLMIITYVPEVSLFLPNLFS